MNPTIKSAIQSQYHAALLMLQQAVEAHSTELWTAPGHENPSWRVAFHALFYTHLYLQDTEDDFVPWEGAPHDTAALGEPPDVEGLSQDEVMEYLAFCRAEVNRRVPGLDLESTSGFYWIPLDKFELQLYSIRHIMQHTGELMERLASTGGPDVEWVGTAPHS